MQHLNKLLQRQVSKYIMDPEFLPKEIRVLLNVISESYDHYEKDRRMLERSIDLSSGEMVYLNERLKSDIREREKTEKELTDIHADLNILLENIEDVLFSVDIVNQKITHVSAAAEQVYGFKPADFILNSNLWREVIHPDDQHIADKQIEMLELGLKVHNQYRIIHKDQSIRWIENKIIPTLDGSGNLQRLDGISSDITEKVMNEEILKENELRLAESERKYRSLFEKNPMPMWVAHPVSLKFLDVNNAAVKHYGYSRNEFLNMTILDIRSDEEKKRFLKHGWSMKPQISSTNWKHIKKDGTEIIVEVNSDTIEFEGMKARLVLANDVTDRIKADEKVKRSNERYELATRATNDAIWDWNLETNELYWSEGYEKLFGYKIAHENVNFNSWTSRVHPDDVKRVRENITAKMNDPGAGFWEDEYRYYKADGSIAHIYDRGFVVYNEKNQPLRMVGAMQDITKRKKMEDVLHKSEANLRTIFNNTDVSYLMLDKEFNIISFNHCAAQVYRKELGQDLVEGMNLIDYLPEERKRSLKIRYSAVLKGRKLNYETSFKRKDETVCWYEMNVFPVSDDNNNIFGLIIATEDITNRKNTELEKEKMTSDIIQRNKDLEQFAYIISHNLRSPVANIIGLTNMLQDTSCMSAADYRKCMEGITVSVKKLDSVIIDLNYILQVRREVNEKKELVRFSGLTRDIKTSINNLIEKENITIKTNFIDINEFFTIKSYLNSIFYNLILNSIKYRHPDRPAVIEITGKRMNSKLMLSFKDNGLGIDVKTHQEKIFGLYKKFHHHIEGKGMGLYMVKTQAEILGGRISVRSEVDRGTEFTIEFDVNAA